MTWCVNLPKDCMKRTFFVDICRCLSCVMRFVWHHDRTMRPSSYSTMPFQPPGTFADLLRLLNCNRMLCWTLTYLDPIAIYSLYPSISVIIRRMCFDAFASGHIRTAHNDALSPAASGFPRQMPQVLWYSFGPPVLVVGCRCLSLVVVLPAQGSVLPAAGANVWWRKNEGEDMVEFAELGALAVDWGSGE